MADKINCLAHTSTGQTYGTLHTATTYHTIYSIQTEQSKMRLPIQFTCVCSFVRSLFWPNLPWRRELIILGIYFGFCTFPVFTVRSGRGWCGSVFHSAVTHIKWIAIVTIVCKWILCRLLHFSSWKWFGCVYQIKYLLDHHSHGGSQWEEDNSIQIALVRQNARSIFISPFYSSQWIISSALYYINSVSECVVFLLSLQFSQFFLFARSMFSFHRCAQFALGIPFFFGAHLLFIDWSAIVCECNVCML